MTRALALPVAAFAALLWAQAPGPASAQTAEEPEVAEMRTSLESCLAASDGRATDEDCIGAPSTACMDTPGGDTTVGMAGCLVAEAQAWDAILNTLWTQVKAEAAQADADDAPQEMGLPAQGETLLAAQRAWIAFRDAECLHAYAMAGTGSIRDVEGASCRLSVTALRVLDFREWVRPSP